MKVFHIRKAKTPWQAMIGLIGAKKPYPLLLTTRFGIHTFGLRFPIDVIILDNQYTVVRIKQSLLPNRIFFWPPYWAIVLELPSGTIAQRTIHYGDTLKLVFS